MFLSQYSMLKSLGYGDDAYVKEETEKVLQFYKLFVLVLHDPEKHASFHQKFSQLFEKLDYLTGRSLLFMGIAKPSYDWYIKNQSRDYFSIWERDQLMLSFQEIKGRDNSIISYSIANAMGIDYDEMPCLIISPDLRSKHIVCLKTGEKYIERQLTELGYFASSVEEKRGYIYSDKFRFLIGKVNSYQDYEFKTLHESIAATLTDILSFTVSDNNHSSRDANKHTLYVTKKLKAKLSESENTAEIERVKINILANLAEKFHGKDLRTFQEKSSNISFSPSVLSEDAAKTRNAIDTTITYLVTGDHGFERESKIIASTTSVVWEMFEKSRPEQSFDFSPLVLGLSKIFEIEANLSIVHWIRKYLKIEMPEFFKKYKPYFDHSKISPDKSLVNNPMAIDFNMHRGVKWLAPGIGQSELIVRSLFNKRIYIETFTETEESGLLASWSPVRELRNRAAHNDIMNKKDFESAAFNMKSLIDSGNISKILNLKKIYQGCV